MSSPSTARSDGNKKRSGDDITRESGHHQANGKALREEKRRRWLAKQEKKSLKDDKDEQRKEWFQSNDHFAKMVSLKDINQVMETAKKDHGENPQVLVDDGLALLLQPYRNIQDKKELKMDSDENKTQEQERYFIAEGTETVRLLIQHQLSTNNQVMASNRLPPLELKSVFIKTAAFFENPVMLQKDVEAVCTTNNDHTKTTPPFSVLVGSEEVQSKVVGFPFCRGALACGIVPHWVDDETWLWEYLKSHPRFQNNNNDNNATAEQPQPTMRIVALDGVCDTANLGSVVRSASAFGVDAMILSHDCCDAWYRKAVRVSMGHVARVPCVRVSSLSKTIQRLQDELDVVAFAAVIADDNCVLEHLERRDVSGAWCCVIGNEGNGICREVANACKKRLRIDMEAGVDSLSIPVAAGILLHGLKERERESQYVARSQSPLLRRKMIFKTS